jgi:hypothetical protein
MKSDSRGRRRRWYGDKLARACAVATLVGGALAPVLLLRPAEEALHPAAPMPFADLERMASTTGSTKVAPGSARMPTPSSHDAMVFASASDCGDGERGARDRGGSPSEMAEASACVEGQNLQGPIHGSTGIQGARP